MFIWDLSLSLSNPTPLEILCLWVRLENSHLWVEIAGNLVDFFFSFHTKGNAKKMDMQTEHPNMQSTHTEIIPKGLSSNFTKKKKKQTILSILAM